MLYKTRGIIFKTTPYSESSIVAQIFTEKFGLQSYLLQGVRKPKSKIRKNMLQPLHLAEMVVYHKQNGNIQRISDLRQVPVFQTIPYNVLKSGLVMFLNEILYKCVKQHHEDENLFNYIFNAVEYLDGFNGNLANFHISFLLKLTRYLGFYPDITDASDALYFDLMEGAFKRNMPPHRQFTEPGLTSLWLKFIEQNFEDASKIFLSALDRKELIEKLLEYYKLHIDGFGVVNSHLVLEEVLR